MGDSDEEYDHRRRDKFARERDDYGRRGDNRGYQRRGYQDQRGPPHRDYSPGPDYHDPPAKRYRRDWDDGGRGGYRGGGGGYPGRGYHGNPPPPDRGEMWNPPPDRGERERGPPPPQAPLEDSTTQPLMMSFKQFLDKQDDKISEADAAKLYANYKCDFQKEQIAKFFNDHKDEEWFKLKYHPDEFDKRKEEAKKAISDRLQAFMEFYTKGWLNDLSCDIDRHIPLVRLLDAIVIRLEGGTDFDLKALDMPAEEDRPAPRRRTVSGSSDKSKSKEEPKEEAVADGAGKKDKRKNKKKKTKGSDSDSDSSISSSGSISDSSSLSSSEEEDEPAPPGMDEPLPPGTETDANGSAAPPTTQETDADKEEDGEAKPRPLHRTKSIFLRNLDPSITRQEIEAMCRQYPGFIRVALQDPQPERRWLRRGWVTFEPSVNIKEICWNLNNIRLKECDMGAIVNRDLKQRIRPQTGILLHKSIVRNDIKICAKIIENLDRKWGLWQVADKESSSGGVKGLYLQSQNPILQNITDYLVEEGSYLEDELLGLYNGGKPEGPDHRLEKDSELNAVLDRMLLYLRVVHSIDYYSGMEYPAEDEMPHRCGLMHVRGHWTRDRLTPQDVQDHIGNFEKKISHLINMELEVSEDDGKKLGLKEPETEVEKFITDNTQELAKDKWLCPLSGKKFKGPEFIRKHIQNKHVEKLEQVQREVAYFNNYLLDPKRPMLPANPAERPQEPGIEGRGGPGYGPSERGGGWHDRGGGHHPGGYYNQGPPHYRQGPPRQMNHHPGGYGGRGGFDRPDRGGYGGRGGYDGGYRGPPGGYNNRGRRDPRGPPGYRDLDAPDPDNF